MYMYSHLAIDNTAICIIVIIAVICNSMMLWDFTICCIVRLIILNKCTVIITMQEYMEHGIRNLTCSVGVQ